MTRDRALLFVACEAIALVALACLALGAVVCLRRPVQGEAVSAAPATPTPALNLAAPPAGAPSPTSLIPTLPPRGTAAPLPTRAAPTTSQTAPAPTDTPVPAGRVPSATLPAADAGSPTTAPAASPIEPSASPAGSASPTATPPPTDLPQPSPTNVPRAGAIGQRFVGGGIGLTVMGVSKQGEAWPVRLVVDVVLENVGLEQASYEFFYFSVLDSDGIGYDATADAPEPSLQAGNLALGSQVRANVAFAIEPEARGLTLIYNPWLSSGDHEPIQVNLGQ